jgi:CDP-2,3-bis-(O-geranylgeranyl)-sn-glycerol synthase
MQLELLTTFLYLIPAYISNSSCALAVKIPFVKKHNKPIHPKLLGTHKTWAGLILGTLIGTILGFAIYIFTEFGSFTLAFLGAFGALIGDSIKSFFKRRLNIASGQPFIPFDQIDLVVGSLILQSVITPIPNYVIVLGLLITPILHLGSNIIAYKLKLKEVWW